MAAFDVRHQPGARAQGGLNTPNLPAPEFSIMLGAFAFMVAVALAAFYIPAWRASKTSPMLVLRHE